MNRTLAFYMPAFVMGDARIVAATASSLTRRGYKALIIVDDSAGPHRSCFPTDAEIVVLAPRESWTMFRDHRARSIANWFRLRHVLKSYNPSWLLVSHTAAGAAAALMAARSLKRRIYVGLSLRGAPAASRRLRLLARPGYWLLGRILSAADLLVGDAHYICHAWEPWLRGRKVRFVGSAPLPPADQTAQQFLPSNKIDPLAISFARLTPQKRVDVCIRAIARVREQGIQIKLEVFGEDGDGRAVFDLIERMNMTDCIRLTGFTRDVGPHLRSADVYVQSSDWEPLGLGVLEALNCGLPVVSTDCAGPSEILADGIGWLAPKGDDGALASAIIEALRAPRYDMRRQERAQEYGLERGLDKLLAMMDEIVV